MIRCFKRCSPFSSGAVISRKIAVGLGLMMALVTQAESTMRLPSAEPPGGLEVDQVPMFVMIGFDDNPDLAPMRWILDFLAEKSNPTGSSQTTTFDGAPVRVAFYSNGKYLENSLALRELHQRAFREGHEIGNHTHNHFSGGEFEQATWAGEMNLCHESLLACNIPAAEIQGFRAPYLDHNDAMFLAARERGLIYDTSLQEGVQPHEDGTNFLWPFTLDQGSPGNAWYHGPGSPKHVTSHPGFWEIPLHMFMVPPDAQATEYDIEPGLAQRIHDSIAENQGWEWSQEDRKIAGLDWNVLEGAGRSADEFYAILKHTLDLRLAGNRAPLMVGAHTAMYPEEMSDRREAIETFITYALSYPEVRIVTPADVLTWLRDPVALRE